MSSATGLVPIALDILVPSGRFAPTMALLTLDAPTGLGVISANEPAQRPLGCCECVMEW